MILCLEAIRFFGPADAVETEKRYDTTVMVYLCGSNLESEGGSATADITEMLLRSVRSSRDRK